MNACIEYPSPRSVTYAVKRELDSQGWSPLSARPWNMYEPDTTLWWIVPSTDWPAYKYGKLFFSQDRAPEGSLFCGLHVEKGLDPSVSAAYPTSKGQSYVMREDWIWHSFLGSLSATVMKSAITRVQKETGAPVRIRLEGGHISDPGGFDPYATRPKFKWDVVVFSATESSLEPEYADNSGGLLRELIDCSSLNDLKASITRIPGNEWVWLDFFIGTIFERRAQGCPKVSWNARELLKNALVAWKEWFR